MSDPIYIKSKIMHDDVFCNKSKELMDAVDDCIAVLKTNPSGVYRTIDLKREDDFGMKVSFFGDHPNVYVYVSGDASFSRGESRIFDLHGGCGDLHDHVAKVLAQH